MSRYMKRANSKDRTLLVGAELFREQGCSGMHFASFAHLARGGGACRLYPEA